MADNGHQGKGEYGIQDKDDTYFVGFDIMNGQGEQSVGKQGIQSQKQQDQPAGKSRDRQNGRNSQKEDKAVQVIRK